MEIVQLSKRSC